MISIACLHRGVASIVIVVVVTPFRVTILELYTISCTDSSVENHRHRRRHPAEL
jgi:hypothetical protein